MMLSPLPLVALTPFATIVALLITDRLRPPLGSAGLPRTTLLSTAVVLILKLSVPPLSVTVPGVVLL